MVILIRNFISILCLQTISVDKRETILHVLDTAFNFQAAAFLPGESSEDVEYAFVKCWARLYIGDPEAVLVDHGSVLISKAFQTECDESNVKLHFTETEAHSSLGAGETYPAPLRRVYLKC